MLEVVLVSGIAEVFGYCVAVGVGVGRLDSGCFPALVMHVVMPVLLIIME